MAAAHDRNPTLKKTAPIRPPKAPRAPKPAKPTNEAERRARAIQLAEEAQYVGVPRTAHVGPKWVRWAAPSRSQADTTYNVLYDRGRDTFYCGCPGFKGHLYCAHVGAALLALRQIAYAESAAGRAAQAAYDRFCEDLQTRGF